MKRRYEISSDIPGWSVSTNPVLKYELDKANFLISPAYSDDTRAWLLQVLDSDGKITSEKIISLEEGIDRIFKYQYTQFKYQDIAGKWKGKK